MSVDLGHEFFKVGLMRQGQPLEIVLNSHSKRKSTTAVSYFEQIRTFGDDALAHQGKAPAKTPMFFHSLLGQNFSADAIAAGGAWWDQFGLGDKFYSYKLEYDVERGVPAFRISDENLTSGEEVLAGILSFAKGMAEESADGKPVKDTVITIPSEATLRQRQAVVAAAEIAGLRVLTLVHETSSFSVQRAVDYTPEKGASEIMLFYNLGSRKTEVSVVKFESRSAGMVAGKMAPVVTVLGSAVDYSIGGHLMDLKIANAMLAQFKEKKPALAGIDNSPRALRKLLSQAQKTKAILSSNKVAPFIVESLFEDTDFQATIKREDFEEMCKDMFDRLTVPLEKALKIANATLADIHGVEVVGGAWRVPKVQSILSEFFAKEKQLPLGQHLNGEEAGALGAALVAANSSSSFRVKKIFFSDITAHEYAVQVVSLTGEWERNVTVLYPVGAPLGGKKKLTFSLEDDFAIKIFEDGVLVTEYTVTGLKDVLQGKWKEYNMTGLPKISATVPLENSGIIEVKVPTATVEESYWVNVTKPKVKNATDAANASSANATGEEAPKEEAKDEAAKEDTPKEEAKEEEGSKEEAKEAAKDDAAKAEESAGDAANETNATVEEEVEIVQKLKKKKHDKKLTLTRVDYLPKPLTDAQIKDLRAAMETVKAAEQEVLAVAGMKNELEAAIYGSRDRLEREDIVKVSTEEQREAVTKLCTEYEDWMYESGATKSDYETRLAALQGLLGPMDERAMEMESRADLPEMIEEDIKGMKKDKDTIEKEMPWVNASKTEKAAQQLEEFEEWWKKKQESQAGLPLHEAPAYTKKEVQDKVAKLQKEFDKLKKIKKPKEPKKPKAAKNATSDENATAPEPEKEEKLPETLEEAEKELASIRDKKANAVENEDFDAAHSLKQRESTLVKHVETLKAAKTEL
jgi:hypoxia up-regulated 1